MPDPATHPPALLKPWQAARRLVVARDRRLDELAGEATGAAAAALAAAGYHRHDRGGWRLRRREGGGMGDDLRMSRVDRDETADLLAASAARGTRSADAARAYFDRCVAINQAIEPLLIKLHGGDPAQEAESALVDRLGRGEHLRREAARRHAERFRRDLLAAEEPTAIERVVVDRAVVCYLAVQLAEAELRAWDDRRPRTYVEKRVDHAQRRLLDVLKALDHLRKKVPTAHLARVRVLGDLVIGPPPAIDVTPEPEATGP